MVFSPGAKLSSYEIVGALGAGGTRRQNLTLM
jgi:hypothetical protein